MMKIKHGLYADITGKKNRLYHIWEDMKNRCNNSKNRRFKSYGGRGIKVCPEWQIDYLSFHIWAMSAGYTNKLTIDRIDVNGNYSAENCRWATQKEQGNNRTNNIMITYQGVTKSMTIWAEDLGMTYATLRNRIKRGWSTERALLTPKENYVS